MRILNPLSNLLYQLIIISQNLKTFQKKFPEATARKITSRNFIASALVTIVLIGLRNDLHLKEAHPH